MGTRIILGLKRRALTITLAVLFSCSSPLLPAQDDGPESAPPGDASTNVSFQTFYDSLANQGTWIQSPDYGYVWQPTVSDAQWAPYTAGHWVYTQDGWTWVSDEPWGWATYHYGRWVNLDATGWCWVPGYTWGPAWVSWRYGGDYCGWAPLPPDSLVGIDYASGDTDFDDGFHIGGDCDSYYGIGPGWYNFLPVVYLGDSDYRGYYANRRDNYRLINRTTNVTNINVNRRERNGNFGGVSLGGPSYLRAASRSQTPIQRLDLTYTGRIGGGAVAGRSLAIFAPRVDVNSLSLSRPAGTVHAIARSEINRGTDLSRPLSVNSRLAGPAATNTEIHQAHAGQALAPSDARVASPSRGAASSAHTSFTSMRPIGYSEGGRSGTPVRPAQTYPGGSQGYSNKPGFYGPQRSQGYSGPAGNSPNYERSSSQGSPSYQGQGGGYSAPSSQGGGRRK